MDQQDTELIKLAAITIVAILLAALIEYIPL